MSIKDMVPVTVMNKIGVLGRKLDVASPKILLAAGIGGFVTTTVLASRATLNADILLDEAEKKLEKIQKVYSIRDSAEIQAKGGYSDEDYLRDRIVFYSTLTVDLAKLYAPAILVGSFSIFCFVKSNNILSQRNMALTMAYAGLHKSYEAYRDRVRDFVGEDQERDIYLGSKSFTREITNSDGEVELVTDLKIGPDSFSPYARFFDASSNQWSKTPEYNFVFLRAQQNFANDLLRSRGYIFLNEVYDMLGLERSYQGQVVGWMIGHQDGDNFVDFGFMDQHRERARAFVNGIEGSVLLDFNVDGVIIDKIPNFRGRP